MRAIAESVVRGLAENKQHSYDTSQDVSTTMTASDVSAMAQGDGAYSRDGDIISPLSLTGNIMIRRDLGATANTLDYVRVLLVRWLPNNFDEAPTSGAIFRDATSAFGHLAFVKADRKKFQVLWDWMGVLPSIASGVSGHTTLLKVRIPLRRRKIYFNAAATTGSSHIYLITLGQTAIGTENTAVYPELKMTYLDA